MLIELVGVNELLKFFIERLLAFLVLPESFEPFCLLLIDNRTLFRLLSSLLDLGKFLQKMIGTGIFKRKLLGNSHIFAFGHFNKL